MIRRSYSSGITSSLVYEHNVESHFSNFKGDWDKLKLRWMIFQREPMVNKFQQLRDIPNFQLLLGQLLTVLDEVLKLVVCA